MQNSIWNSSYFSPEVVQLFLIVHLSEFFPVDFQRFYDCPSNIMYKDTCPVMPLVENLFQKYI